MLLLINPCTKQEISVLRQGRYTGIEILSFWYVFALSHRTHRTLSHRTLSHHVPIVPLTSYPIWYGFVPLTSFPCFMLCALVPSMLCTCTVLSLSHRSLVSCCVPLSHPCCAPITTQPHRTYNYATTPHLQSVLSEDHAALPEATGASESGADGGGVLLVVTCSLCRKASCIGLARTVYAHLI